eukprot:7297-Heterococcus_DN1.PRE.2
MLSNIGLVQSVDSFDNDIFALELRHGANLSIRKKPLGARPRNAISKIAIALRKRGEIKRHKNRIDLLVPYAV